MIKDRKLIVVMPVYNSANSLRKTFDALPGDIIDDVILLGPIIAEDVYDCVLGSRILGMVALKGDMPLYNDLQLIC